MRGWVAMQAGNDTMNWLRGDKVRGLALLFVVGGGGSSSNAMLDAGLPGRR